MERETLSKSGLSRFKTICAILLKYGVRDKVEQYHLRDFGLVKRITGIEEGLSIYTRIRMVLEELGPTFIKFGQVASMRPDLVPAELMAELEQLQDAVPPEPFPEVVAKLEAEFGSLDAVFSEFDTEPFAAASLSQVHRAVLRENGAVVAVKVRRPKAFSTIQADLKVLAYLASLLHERYHDLRVYNLPGLVGELKYSINNELDFLKEAANIKVFRAGLDPDALVTAPRVYDAYTTRKVLTMEFVEGQKVSQYEGDSLQRQKLAQAGIDAQVRQIFQEGFFHADPHAGNVLITPSGKLCLLDWGMVGRLTPTMRRNMVDLLCAVTERDEEHLARIAIEAFDIKAVDSMLMLQRDIRELLDTFFATDQRQRSAGRFLLDFLTVFQQHNRSIPAQYAFMSKALLTMEGLGHQLHPEIDTVESLEPHLSQLARERFSRKEIVRKLKVQCSDSARLMEDLPYKAGRILDNLEKGEFNFRLEGTQRFEKAVVKSTNRLTMGIVLGSFIMGSSMIISAKIPPLFQGHSALGVAGLAFSGFVGLWLILDIWRERKRR
ncbi:MAG: AarF/UbiB family protein [Eubacteriales bacterium]|jgi:ubiquinone biosynthesis protein|nr:hypothetical protein [Bacillota bacterium]MBV1728614.1 hypothetical protein [Desulforudis sp.]MDZ4042813.1 AarF/UbiB family protein [Eubacteriales bacterium]MBU4554787.1 hypothetical protein [Bacillota bacterium]MBV1769351.1 hypothetical protein [Desulforudis sp.]